MRKLRHKILNRLLPSSYHTGATATSWRRRVQSCKRDVAMETSDDERDWGENGCVEWVSISCGRGTWEQMETDQTDWLRDRSVQASPVVYSRHTQTRSDDPSATVGAPVTSRNAGVQVINDYWSNQSGTQTMPQAGCSVPCQCQAASVDMDTEDSSSKTSNDADDGTVPPHSQIAEPQMLTSAEQPSVGKSEEAHNLCYYESRADATLSQQSILTAVEIPVNSQSEGNIDPDEETSELNQPKVVQIPPPPPAGRNVYDIDLPGLLEAYRILYNHYAAFQTESISSSCSTRTALLAGHAAMISTDTEEDIPTSKPPSISVAEMSYIRGTREAVDMAKSASTERCDGNDAATDSEGGLDFSVTSRKDELVNKESDCTMMRDYGVSEDHVDLFKMSVSDALNGEKGAAIISKDKPLDNGSGKLRLQDGEESPGISPLDAAEVLFAMSKKSNNKDPNDKKEGDCGSRNVTFRGCCQAEHPDVGDKDGNCLDLSTEIETEPYIENKMVVDEKLRSDDIGNSRLNRNRSTETAWWSNYRYAALNQASQHSHDQNKESGNQDTTICKAPVSAMRIASQEDVFGTVCSATPSLSPVTLVQEKQMCLQADGHETPSHVSVCEQKVSEVYHGAPAEKEYDESFTVTTRQQWKNFVSARQVQARTKKESVEVDNTKPCDSFEKGKEEEEVEPLESMKKDGLKTVSYQSERNIQHSNHQETRSISEKKAQTSKVGPGVRSPYTCQICKKKFKSYARFFYHLRHSVKCTKAGKQRLGQTKYVCRMCEGQYATNKGYEKHSCFKQRMLRPRIRRVSYNEDSYTESDVNTSTSQDNQCADSEDVKFETKFPLIEAGAISEESQSHEESCENKAQGSQCKDNHIELKAESTRKGQSSDSYLKTEIVSTIVNMFVDDTQPGCSDTTGDIDNIQLGCCETLGMHLDVPGCVQDPNHNSEGLTTGTSERSLETCGAAQAVQEYSDEVFRRELRVLAGGLVDSWLGGNCDGNSHQSSLGGPVYESVSSIGMDHNYSAQVTTVMPTQAVPPTVALDMFTAAITVPKE
ncbi:Hypp4275 [Branchiostoma lanceolatum]|uniref:Hypp4275 protein n=1 Tax=Branchiostoma lanceolatum TaxID=7740 RepID=A0A8K0A652_BRALA|nr:Hypp4275 [Branchiostoma lanceolatum]